MRRLIIETKEFARDVDDLIASNKLLHSDFEELKSDLAKNPEIGDLMPNTGGLRKVRLKSASRGKSGGFRVCYYYLTEDGIIYLIAIYQKNEKENITDKDKKEYRNLIKLIK
jgi:mRNA-degrading endonuclease RelE of RelBE toxin-antitoxin system